MCKSSKVSRIFKIECRACEGDGECPECSKWDRSPTDCSFCDGDGSVEEPCFACDETGEEEHPCSCLDDEDDYSTADPDCDQCEGLGYYRDGECEECEGEGEILETCPDCNGSGEIEFDKHCYRCEGLDFCRICGGHGFQMVSKMLKGDALFPVQ